MIDALWALKWVFATGSSLWILSWWYERLRNILRPRRRTLTGLHKTERQEFVTADDIRDDIKDTDLPLYTDHSFKN